MKILLFFVGLLLIPAATGSTRALLRLISSLSPLRTTTLPVEAWWLAGGFCFCLLLFFTLSRPVRTYVLGHELTHALWATFWGASVSRLRVGPDGGSVMLSKTNAFITLAPYFFPFYTVLVILGYYLLGLFLPVEGYAPFWLAAVGFTWAFHLCFTISSLMQHQTDIEEYGYLFSYVMIYLFNVLGISLWIVMVTDATLQDFITRLGSELAGELQWGWDQLTALHRQLAPRLQ